MHKLASPLLLLAASSPLLAQGTLLPLQDIHSAPRIDSSIPTAARSAPGNSWRSDFVRCGNQFFFTADQAGTGRELWVTDGSASGTRMVVDLRIGPLGSKPHEITCLGNSVVFAAEAGVHGPELWISNGTATGTRPLRDGAGSSVANPRFLVESAGKVYFAATQSAEGRELWSTDGQTTSIAADIRSGSAGSFPRYLFVLGSRVYFQAFDATHGAEPWVFDGTTATLLRDVATGTASSAPDFFCELNGTLLFRATTDNSGTELWKSDGTTSNTVLLKDIRPGSTGSTLSIRDHGAKLNGQLFFTADDGSRGQEVWVTDATTAGTRRITDIVSGSSSSDPRDLAVAGGRLYFRARTDELWVIEGSNLTPQFAVDLGLGSLREPSAPGVEFQGAYYFGAGGALWCAKGASTTRLTDRLTGRLLQHLTVVNPNLLLFSGPDLAAGTELMSSDGSRNGTGLLLDIEPGVGTRSATPGPLSCAPDGRSFLFAATDEAHGRELWTGDAQGASLRRDLRSGPQGSDPKEITHCWLQGRAVTFFSAADDFRGRELWRDGDSAPLRDIAPGTSSGDPRELTLCNDLLFFSAVGAEGLELWKSDGTSAGTTIVRDIRPGTDGGFAKGSRPTNLTRVGSLLFFAATDDATGSELWVSDGTNGGTRRVADIRSGSDGSFPAHLIACGDVLYFTADDGSRGRELWSSDGSGASRVQDLRPGSTGSFPYGLTSCGDALFFAANNGSQGIELWEMSLTNQSVAQRDIEPGSASSQPASLTDADGRLFFTAARASEGRELWVLDPGSPPRLVLDLLPGSPGSAPTNLLAASGGVYFAARGTAGRELWFSDGTGPGTQMVADLRTGAMSSNPEELAICSGRLFFTADNGHSGREIYVLPGPQAAVERVGQGSAVTDSSLECSTPSLGSQAVHRTTGGPAGYTGFLVVTPPVAPYALPQTRAGACFLIDFANILLPVGVVSKPSPGSAGTVSFGIPPIPGLAGVSVHSQVIWTNDQTIYPVELSNGLRLTLATTGPSAIALTGRNGGGAEAYALDRTRPPAANFDLTRFKHTLPIARGSGATSMEISERDLAAGDAHREFIDTGRDGGLVFRVQNWGKKTSTNTRFTRSETREMLRTSTSSSTSSLQNNWVFSTRSAGHQRSAAGVDGILRATLKMDHVTRTGHLERRGRVVIGQIHAGKNEPARLYYFKQPGHLRGSIYLAHEFSTRVSSNEQWFELIGSRSSSASEPTDGIALGEVFGYTIEAEGHFLSIVISRPGRADLTRVFDMSSSGYAEDHADNVMYFKAGVYNQNGSGDSSNRLDGDPEDYVQATFYELVRQHSSR